MRLRAPAGSTGRRPTRRDSARSDPARRDPTGRAPAAERPRRTAPPPGATPPAAAAKDSSQLLKQLVGNEEVIVTLRLDLLLVRGDVKLPEVGSR